jgi:hypothetical protein
MTAASTAFRANVGDPEATCLQAPISAGANSSSMRASLIAVHPHALLNVSTKEHLSERRISSKGCIALLNYAS